MRAKIFELFITMLLVFAVPIQKAEAAYLRVDNYDGGGGFIGQGYGNSFLDNANLNIDKYSISGSHGWYSNGEYQIDYSASASWLNSEIKSHIRLDLSALSDYPRILDGEVSVYQEMTVTVVGNTIGEPVEIRFDGEYLTAADLWPRSTGYLNASFPGGSIHSNNLITGIEVAPISWVRKANTGDTLNFITYLNGRSTVAPDSEGVVFGSIESTFTGHFTVTAVPEPAQYLMLLAGGIFIAISKRQRINKLN